MGSSLVLNEDPLIGEKVWFNASHFYTLPGYFEGWCNDTDQVDMDYSFSQLSLIGFI
jgi:hypothetical protein